VKPIEPIFSSSPTCECHRDFANIGAPVSLQIFFIVENQAKIYLQNNICAMLLMLCVNSQQACSIGEEMNHAASEDSDSA
jgi:hypothetical protein